MKEIIEKIVRQEIQTLLAKNKEVIKGMVETSLLPQLRMAIRTEITDVMAQLLEQSPEMPQKNPAPIQEDPYTESIQAEIPKSMSSPGPGNSALHILQSGMGRYLYCIADGAEAIRLGDVGIEKNEVYTIPFKDLCSVVHNCPAEPYQSEDQDIVKEWVLTHQKVVDAAWKKFGTIIPIGFDTIIQGKDDMNPEENMKAWLKEDYDNLKAKMAKIREKAEYGVQIFWETRIIAHNISEESAEIKAMQEEIKTKSKGLAYMHRQNLEELLKKKMEQKADQYFQEFYEKIKPHTDDLHVEKTKKAEDENQQMLLSLSCLLPKDQSKNLGAELEKFDAMNGFSVRYTGPWPPYSFV